ncbi:MAG: phosphohistidine phosphatase [Glaciecola sp.]|jgi:phosphohistidine phosphatase
MIIFVMRHGEAEPYKQDDKSRHLTRFGITQSEHAAKWIVSQLKQHLSTSSIDLTYVSPYVRTIETLESIERFVAFDKMVSSSMVTPEGRPNEVQDLIDGELLSNDKIQSLLIVTHMPLVSLLSDVLCSGFNGRIFDTAEVLLLDYDAETSQGNQLGFYQSLT